jgi:hypothetical protein
MRHPTISAWQRQEDGSYAAELHGWSLRVTWHPESAEGRGFSWVAERDDERQKSDAIYEEIEVAMGAAEAQVSPDAAAPAPESEEAAPAGHH